MDDQNILYIRQGWSPGGKYWGLGIFSFTFLKWYFDPLQIVVLLLSNLIEPPFPFPFSNFFFYPCPIGFFEDLTKKKEECWPAKTNITPFKLGISLNISSFDSPKEGFSILFFCPSPGKFWDPAPPEEKRVVRWCLKKKSQCISLASLFFKNWE